MHPAAPERSILVVEDDPSSGNALKYLLSSHGFRVEVAMTLAAAMNRVRSNPPDAVVLDLMLPDGDGLSLLEFLRKQQSTTRVIITTGVLDPQWLARADALQPVTLLKKPIWMEELLKHL